MRHLPTSLAPAEHLAPGDRLRGPALVLREDTTVLVPPGFELCVLASGDLWLQPGRSAT